MLKKADGNICEPRDDLLTSVIYRDLNRIQLEQEVMF